MAKPTKKDLEKRRRERDRKRRVISERALAAGITPWVEPVRPVPPPHVEFPTRPEPLPTRDSPMEREAVAERAKEALAARDHSPPPRREQTEEEKQIHRWWQEYKHGDGETRLQMAREKLDSLDPDDEQFEAFFPDAISEVEPKLGRERYVAFLEEIRDRWPRVFSQEIDWNVWQMAFVYVAEGRWSDLERAVVHMAEEMKKVREPFFSLVSYLRLANRGFQLQRLARKLDFMSLDRFHVPAGILAMYHFYDFLAETKLVDETIHRPSQLVCLDLWKEIKKLFQEKLGEWQPCQFLEQYATWNASAK